MRPALLAFVSVLLASAPALAQQVDPQVLALRAELAGIDTSGPDAAAEIGAQLVFAGALFTLGGSIAELLNQELSARWRFAEPPWYALTGVIAGAVLGAIGTPLLVWALSDGRVRRRQELQEELRLELGLAGLSLAGSF